MLLIIYFLFLTPVLDSKRERDSMFDLEPVSREKFYISSPGLGTLELKPVGNYYGVGCIPLYC